MFDASDAAEIEKEKTDLAVVDQNGGPLFFEQRIRNRILETTKFRVNLENGRTGIGGIIRDITARKQAEEELANTRRLLEQAFEQSPYPMALVSMPDAVVRIANPAIREFLEIMDEPTPVGQSLFEMNMSWKDCDRQGNPVPLAELPLPLALKGEKTVNREIMAVTTERDGPTRTGQRGAHQQRQRGDLGGLSRLH